jgi:GntR family transcriptional regulator/MocR family aminotransferase
LPSVVFRQVSAKQLRRLERKPSSFRSPRGNQGNYFLRDAIVKHIALTRAFVCQPEDILVTSGASGVLGAFVRALFTFQRRVACRVSIGKPLVGAVAFV